MSDFQHGPPPQKIAFGIDAVQHLPGYLRSLGWRRVLLATTGSARRSGRAAQVEALLGETLAFTYDRVQPHVPAEQVEEAFRFAHEHAVDGVIGLGGGSAIGLAKGVAYVLNALRAGQASDPDGSGAAPPAMVAAIPTTYAGSEMTPMFGMTTRTDSGPRKVTTSDARVLPRLVIYDPALTVDLPPSLTAATGLNALAHCVEAVYAVNRHPLSTQAALAGAHAIGRALPRCCAHGDDLDARTEMLEGAHMAGKSVADVALGLHHGLCHVLGGSAGVPHGLANAIILPHAMRFNLDATARQLDSLAAAMGLANAPSAIDHIEALIRNLGLPQRLREVGVAQADLPRLAHLAVESKTVKNNPKRVGEAEVGELLRGAW